jgi:phage/plasmid-like protein (TIGR03299 family)
MTANIFGERFFGHREPAWHGLGTVLDEELSVSAAFTKVGMNYEVQKVPLIANVQLDEFASSSEETKVSMPLPTDKFAIVRNPTADDLQHHIFGICSADYEIVQNSEIARLLDPLSEQWKTETVGAIDDGKTIFITLDAGATSLKAKNGKTLDNIAKYFLITETKDGGSAMKFAFTPVRVVCSNTLVTGLKAAVVSSSLTHKTGIRNEMEWRLRLLAEMSKAENAVMSNMQLMAKIVLDNSDLVEIIDAAYPTPKKSSKAVMLESFENPEEELAGYTELLSELTESQASFEYWANRAQIFRTSALDLFKKFNDEQPAFANTPWAAYNAVVETEDYRSGKASMVESALWGARAVAKKRAFAKAMELVG